MGKTLSEFKKSITNFIKIKPGEQYVGIYKGYKIVEKDSFGETQEVARYSFKDPEDGKVRSFDSRSGVLCDAFENMKDGQEFTIAREGEGMETIWDVLIDGKSIVRKEKKKDEK